MFFTLTKKNMFFTLLWLEILRRTVGRGNSTNAGVVGFVSSRLGTLGRIGLMPPEPR